MRLSATGFNTSIKSCVSVGSTNLSSSAPSPPRGRMISHRVIIANPLQNRFVEITMVNFVSGSAGYWIKIVISNNTLHAIARSRRDDPMLSSIMRRETRFRGYWYPKLPLRILNFCIYPAISPATSRYYSNILGFASSAESEPISFLQGRQESVKHVFVIVR